MTCRPFSIFPWDRPFLSELQRYIGRCTDNTPGRCVIIVPHNRPRRYLTDLFRQDESLSRPCLLPRMLTVSEMIALFRAQTTAPLRTAQTLDRIALLHRSVLAVAQEDGDEDLCHRFARMDMAKFFPWGLRLASLLEECLTQQLEAKDIPYTEGEVSPLASALLGALGRIHGRYLSLLESEGWTTPGLDAFVAARALQRGEIGIPPLLRTQEDCAQQVFVAGLAVLSDAENTLLHALWQDGAHICLHTDPELAAASGTAHWACVDHQRWIKDWKAESLAVLPSSGQSPSLSFFAGYDAHSQLLAVQEELAKDAEECVPTTAIVLTSAGLLMPTLHHLPDRDFNVSMGYPLDRSPLNRLLDAIMRVQSTGRGTQVSASEQGENAGEAGERRYHWRALLQCLRHPYVQMLQTVEEEGQKVQHLRDVLHRMESTLRRGSRFAEPLALASLAMVDTSKSQRDLLHKILHSCLNAFALVKTPTDMADALSALCDLLLTHGGDMWERYPLDAESLYRLVQHVIPGLKGSALADTHFPAPALFSLTRQLIQAERVPFEADPIAGLQILGMLETRLLHFERLFVLDATDDALPGFTSQDPLLPDALRELLGLPDAQRRERTSAHTLYRLMACAKEVHFLWQEGIQRSSLFDGKKSRSRFVDEWLWKEERARGHLLSSGTEPLLTAPCPVSAVPRALQLLPAGPLMRQKVLALLEKGISPTRLDSYLQCPQRFAWESLYELRSLEEVNEGDDPAAVGDWIHKALHKAYTPWLQRPLEAGNLTAEDLIAVWEATLAASDLREKLPPDSYMMLSLAAPLRLARYLEKQPENTTVCALEHKIVAPLEAEIQGKLRLCHLRGTLDRVDNRPINGRNSLVVLDYKTGTVRRPASEVWTDVDLWQQIQLWTPEASSDSDILDRVARAFPSVQLPCYIHMCRHANLGPVSDAAWVALREDGEEVFLLGANLDDTVRQAALDVRIPQLLNFLLRHMGSAQSFDPRKSTRCEYCPYGALCHK